MSYLDRTKSIPKFTGKIYYVNPNGDDSNNGLSPETDLQTIGVAIDKLSSGDAIVVGAGNYIENNLNFNVSNCEMWFEIGAQLSPTSGTALIVSGNFCRVICREGALKVNTASGASGIVVTGQFCYLDEIRVSCNSVGTIGFDFQGGGADARRCRCALPTVAAFKIQGDNIKIEDCCTGGEVDLNSIDVWITNSCDKARIKDFGSQGHASSCLQIDYGCTNVSVQSSTAGGGDGHFIDNGMNTFLDLKERDSREDHEHTYPFPNGMGTAGDPIVVNNIITDETGSESTANYFGDPKVIMPVGVRTTDWFLKGVNIYATTTVDEQRFFGYRVNYIISATRNGGDNWDEGTSALTVQTSAEANQFEVGDLVWITSDYKTDGEIVEVSAVNGSIVYIDRQTENSGRTGLHFDHTTNNSGTEKMYLCWRDQNKYHSSDWDYSAGTNKDFIRQNFNNPRRFHIGDGFIVRMVNCTDDGDSIADISIIWSD
jgi:hypothetical protein